MHNAAQTFEEDLPRRDSEHNRDDKLLLNLDGYEGPIDVLLDLAQRQKVDLTKISILALARQYLAFIRRAKEKHLELAAEYLVMAAWLAYLKSRLLIPKDNTEDEHSAEDMAEALQFQLRRLEAMRTAAADLRARPQLGQQIHPRGMPQRIKTDTTTKWNATLYDFLKAYGEIKTRGENSGYDLPALKLMSAEKAMERLTRMLGQLPRKGLNSVWTTLDSFIPEGIKDKTFARSALASTLFAGLEMAKQGKLDIRQDGLFRPIYMRGKGE
jgi:segregation and condensation protein A